VLGYEEIGTFLTFLMRKYTGFAAVKSSVEILQQVKHRNPF
jgi:hypothetical protein